MGLASKVHDELISLENRFADLVEPERIIASKVRDVVRAMVEDIEALAAKIEALAACPAVATDYSAPTETPEEESERVSFLDVKLSPVAGEDSEQEADLS